MNKKRLTGSAEARQGIGRRMSYSKSSSILQSSPPISRMTFFNPIQRLQRTMGNRQVSQWIQARRLTPQGTVIPLRRKLKVSAADDLYEQEAHRLARQVISMPDAVTENSAQHPLSPKEDKDKIAQAKPLADSITSFVQHKGLEDSEEEKPVMAKSNRAKTGNFEVEGDVETRIMQSKGSGISLPEHVRTFMEPRFGVDFSAVRVHTGSNAIKLNRDVGAAAFTHGSDIFYGAGSSPENLELTAHELTHVVQQGGAAIRRKHSDRVPAGNIEEEGNKGAVAVRRKLARQKTKLRQAWAANKQKNLQKLMLSTLPANVLQCLPARVWGSKDATVSRPPNLIQSHIAKNIEIDVSGVSWRWVWRSEWNIYDASDKVVASEGSWKYPDFTLKQDVIKNGTPSDGKGNPWTARFEVTETGYPFGGDDPDNFPWGEAHFHVYASPIANAKFDKKEEVGNETFVIDKIDVGEGETADYSLTTSGSETRSDSSSVTITNTAKISRERESSLSLEYEGVGGGLKNKVGFEASRSIARMNGETLSRTQSLSRTFSKKNLSPGSHTFYLRPVFLVLTGSADVLSQNKGVVSEESNATGSIRIWKGYKLEDK